MDLPESNIFIVWSPNLSAQKAKFLLQALSNVFKLLAAR